MILAIGTIPAHALLLRRRPEDVGLHPDGAPSARTHTDNAARNDVPLGTALRDPTFRWLVLAFGLSTAVAFGVQVHLVPILLERGYAPTFAAVLAGLVGAMHVLGRILMIPFAGRVRLHTMSAVVLALQPLALIALILLSGTLGVVIFVAVFGLPRAA